MKKLFILVVVLNINQLQSQEVIYENDFENGFGLLTVHNVNSDQVDFKISTNGVGENGSETAYIGTNPTTGNNDLLRLGEQEVFTFIEGVNYRMEAKHKSYLGDTVTGQWNIYNTTAQSWATSQNYSFTSQDWSPFSLDYTPSSTHNGYLQVYNSNSDGGFYLIDNLIITADYPWEISTSEVTNIGDKIAKSGGTLTNGTSMVFDTVGLVWDLESASIPSLTSYYGKYTKNYDGNQWVGNMTGLEPNTSYTVRAYATRSSFPAVITYGEPVTFTTTDKCPISDEVYLSNIAFIDGSTAASFGTYFVDYELPEALNYDALNPNNLLNPGLPVSFKVQCSNQKDDGSAIVSGECRLRTSDPQITILDSISGLNNVGWGSTAWSTDEFKIQVSSSVTESFTAYVDFVVIENGEEYVTRCIPIPVKSFSMNQNSIDDDANPDSDGDGDGIVEPGERIETLPTVNNDSEFESSLVAGFLRNLKSYSGIEILNDIQGSSGTIYSQGWYNVSFGSPAPMNAGQLNAAPEYDFVFDYDMDATYSFQLDLIVAGGFYLFDDTSSAATLIRQSTPIYYNSAFPPAVTGIQDNLDKSSNVSIYPNPTNGKISISSEDGQFGSSEVQVFSSIGQLVLSKNDVIIGNNPTEIDLSALPKGVYTLVIAGQGAMSQNQIVLD